MRPRCVSFWCWRRVAFVLQGFPHSLQGNLLSEVSLLTEVFLAAVFSLEDAFLFFLLLAAFYLFWAKLPLPQGFVPLNSVDVDIGTLWVALPYDLPIFQSSNSPFLPQLSKSQWSLGSWVRLATLNLKLLYGLGTMVPHVLPGGRGRIDEKTKMTISMIQCRNDR